MIVFLKKEVTKHMTCYAVIDSDAHGPWCTEVHAANNLSNLSQGLKGPHSIRVCYKGIWVEKGP